MRFLAITIVALAVAGPGTVALAAPPPGLAGAADARDLVAPRLSKPPVLDGSLDDET